MIRILMSSVLVLTVVLGGSFASATTYVVAPGPGTPVPDAIDAAAPGGTSRLTAGQFPEQITITKRLKLRGLDGISSDPDRLTWFDVSCAPGVVITVAADDVQIRDLAINRWVNGGVSVVGR